MKPLNAFRGICLISFTLLLFFSLLLTENALAAFISVNPTQGPPGAQVNVLGNEWRPGDLVNLSWNFLPFATVAAVRADGGGVFTTNVVVPEGAPIGPTQVNAINETGDLTWQAPFTVVSQSAGCADAYFIGAHGWGEGPDSTHQPELDVSISMRETWKIFKGTAEEKGKKVKRHYIDYPSPFFPSSEDGLIQFIDKTINGVAKGVEALDTHVREKVLKECPKDPKGNTPKIVLAGYSIGALVINEWLSKPQTKDDGLWTYIKAVELYGDPLWRRYGPPYPGGDKDTYQGLLRPALMAKLLSCQCQIRIKSSRTRHFS